MTQRGAFAGSKQLADIARERTPIRALILEDHALRGVITGDAELPFRPARVPYVTVQTPAMAGNVPRVAPGQTVLVEGTGFATSNDAGRVVVWIGDEIAARDAPVNEAGRFKVKIPVERMPGEYPITVEQTDGNRLTRDRTTLYRRPAQPP